MSVFIIFFRAYLLGAEVDAILSERGIKSGVGSLTGLVEGRLRIYA
jgi:hypothetical protein